MFLFKFRLKSLAPLLQLTYLRSLCLTDPTKVTCQNPLCNSPSYQQDVKNNLPNLGIFDSNPIYKKPSFFLFIDTLDNEWLGQGFQERLTSLESAIGQLENSKKTTTEKPTIIITQVASSDRSIHIANEEYEELLESIQMLVK